MTARGTFEVRLSPVETVFPAAETAIGRMSIDKTFAGDLEGTSRGEMLTGGDPASGSAGYVAVEQVTGTLHGRAGGFLLQHSGTMTPEGQRAVIEVVPGSGSGGLEGISGIFVIEIEGGRHRYRFDYTLPKGP